MRVDLGELEARGLVLALPAAAGRPERRLTLVSGQELRGLFETGEAGWTLTQLGCREAVLRALAWTFGKVGLASEDEAELVGLRGTVEQGEELRLELSLDTLRAARLVLTVGALRLSAVVEGQALTLLQGAGNGSLQAKHAVFREFEVSSGGLRASVPELRVSELVVDWGGDEFRLEVGTAQASSCDVQSGAARVHAAGVELLALRSRGARAELGGLRSSRLELETSFGQSAEAPARDEREVPSEPTLDLGLLDALAGRLSVDVEVDLSVPILGRRRATHALRLGVEDGAIDYLELESGLSALEDSLLDFSVREGKLVLERGLPILSTRGRGKPLLLWDLDESDHELALRERRVRLAVLPRYRPVKREDDDERERSGGGSFKLRALSLLNLEAGLSLAQKRAPARGLVPELTFASLTLRGQVHHRPDEAPAGLVRAEGEQLRAVLRDLPLSGRAGAGRLEIAALRGVEVAFAGLKATGLRASFEGVALESFELG